MTFRIENWQRASTGANEPLVELESGAVNGCFRTYNYYSINDSQAVVAAAGYFNLVQSDLQTHDIISVYSLFDITYQTYVATNTAGVITVAAIAFPAGLIGTANIAANAVTSAKIDPTIIQLSRLVVTAAQWRGMSAAPLLLIAAPGAGFLHVVDKVTYAYTHVAASYAAGGAVYITYGNTPLAAGPKATLGLAAATVNALAASSTIDETGTTVSVPRPNGTCANAGLYINNDTAAFTTGDGTWVLNIAYRTIPV